MRTSIFGSYQDAHDARNAIGALLDHGARKEDISLVLAGMHPGEEGLFEVEESITTTTAEDAAMGASKGAGVGLGVGTIAALAAVLVPGVGLVLGGGALAIALGAVAATTASGAVAGALTGYLKDQGVPEEFVEESHGTLIAGGAIVAITVPSGMVSPEVATSLLVKYGASGFKSWQSEPGSAPQNALIAAAMLGNSEDDVPRFERPEEEERVGDGRVDVVEPIILRPPIYPL